MGKRVALAVCLGTLACGRAFPVDWSGYVAGELRWFPSEPQWPGQFEDLNLSLSTQPEFYHAWEERNESFTFTPFLRLDQHDPERTHADIRELYWDKAWDRYELSVGVQKVFWGVTESVHLVDIINQTDFVENIDAEDKLGQPMVNVTIIRDWGNVDLFLLPGFRERTFPGRNGRFRAPIPVEDDEAAYESGAEQYHVDWAARYSNSIGPWDLGVYHFMGTSRDPRFIVRQQPGQDIELIPFYDQINQTGLDVQLTLSDWLLKFEGIHRSGMGETYNAFAAGFEYTFWNVRESGIDVGLLLEYLYDDRGDSGALTDFTEGISAFENDVFLGFRLGFNDTQNTRILGGAIVDADDGSTLWTLEASRRIAESLVLSLEARFFTNIDSTDVLTFIKRDDYVQFELAWYF